MLVLGVILVLLAALFVLAAVFGGADDPAAFDLGPLKLSGLNVATVFLLGAMTLLVLVLGIWLLRGGARRAAARRKEQKEMERMSAKLEALEAQQAGDREPATPSTTGPATGRHAEGVAPTEQTGTHEVPPTHDSTPLDRPTHEPPGQEPPPRP